MGLANIKLVIEQVGRIIRSAPFPPEQKRRRAYNDILLAQAYTNKGNYPMAASLAEAGLIVVKDIQSGINIEHSDQMR